MTREQLFNLICDIHPCVGFNLFFNKWLDEYDKHVIEQYKADTNLKDTIREIHDSVANEMYCKAIGEFVKKICEKYTEEEGKGNYKQYCCEIKQNIADIAEQLKAGVKNE